MTTDSTGQDVAARLSEWAQSATSWAHRCESCGRGAAFGFDGPRNTTHWFCATHRAVGEELLAGRTLRS
jgi:hypothetical protein